MWLQAEGQQHNALIMLGVKYQVITPPSHTYRASEYESDLALVVLKWRSKIIVQVKVLKKKWRKNKVQKNNHPKWRHYTMLLLLQSELYADLNDLW